MSARGRRGGPHSLLMVVVRLQTLRKKGFNGCDSLEPDGETAGTEPLLEDKHWQASEELTALPQPG